MRSSVFLIACLASTGLAAPSQTISSGGIFSWSAPLARFYQEIDRIIQEARQSPTFPDPPACDLSKASMPVAPTPLPSPDPDTFLSHIAIGRGVQNYTCADSTSSSTPTAIGAIASLYNASCTQCAYPSLTTLLTNLIINYALPSNPTANLQPSNILLSGHHYFINNGTPIFDLSISPTAQYGFAVGKKDSASPAPSDAPVGQKGEPAVPWLKLNTIEGTRGGLRHVYRVNTVGGSAPKTCEGIAPGVFQVEYSTQYWFYAAPEESRS